MYEGVNASDGIGIGVARVAVEPDLSFTPHAPEDAGDEKQRYAAAVAKFVEQTNAQIARMTETVGEEAAAIMGAHIEFAEDEGIQEMVNGSIEAGMCAEQAVSEAYDMYYNMFSNMEDELFRERAADVADVKTGLLADLLGKEVVDLSTLPENSVVVVHELTPSMTADIDKDNVAAIVTETGGRTSHSAIIARALEIPAVLSVADITKVIKSGDMVIVDGSRGRVLVNPADNDLTHYRAKAKQYAEEKLALEAYRGKETVTGDGEKVLLVANIGNPDDANVAAEHDCEGVGLFRSEFLFMDAKELPSEDEQFAAYQKVALRMKNQPVIIRTHHPHPRRGRRQGDPVHEPPEGGEPLHGVPCGPLLPRQPRPVQGPAHGPAARLRLRRHQDHGAARDQHRRDSPGQGPRRGVQGRARRPWRVL